MPGIVVDALAYGWSSARAHVTGRDATGLLDLDRWREISPLGDWDWVLHEGSAFDAGWMEQLRAATRAGKPLGSKEFIAELAAEAGTDLQLRSVGRPRKQEVAQATTVGSRAS